MTDIMKVTERKSSDNTENHILSRLQKLISRCIPKRSRESISMNIKNYEVTQLEKESILQSVAATPTSPTSTKSPKINFYPMSPFLKSLCIIVNIIEFDGRNPRDGAHHDAANLKKLFKSIDFDVFYFESLTSKEYDCVLEEFRTKYFKDEYKYNSLVFIVMSHGKCNSKSRITKIEFKDGKFRDCYGTVERFNNNNCSGMALKPKFTFEQFILQIALKTCFCGKKIDGGIKLKQYCHFDSAPTERGKLKLMKEIAPTYSDILVAFGSTIGYAIPRFPENGTWYVQAMCDIIQKHGFDTHFEDLLKLIGDQVLEKSKNFEFAQTAYHENMGMFTHFYLRPPQSAQIV